jgi:hypothetical protein
MSVESVGPLGGPSKEDADDALRAAIRAALDAGDIARVKALVAVLEDGDACHRPNRQPAHVVDLAARRNG